MSLLQNLSLSQSVKDFSKSVNIWEGYGPELSVLFFWTHGVLLFAGHGVGNKTLSSCKLTLSSKASSIT